MRASPLKVFFGTLLLLLLTQNRAVTQGALASVEGRVVKAAGGDPLAEVALELVRNVATPVLPGTPGQPPPQRTATITGTDGRFVISNIAPGEYRLYATHPNG